MPSSSRPPCTATPTTSSSSAALTSAKVALRAAANENVLLRAELRRLRRRLVRGVQDQYFLCERLLRHEKPRKGRPPQPPTEEQLRERQRPKRKYKKRKTKAEKEREQQQQNAEEENELKIDED